MDLTNYNNDVESRQEIVENVEMQNEPPNKRRKTYDNGTETAPISWLTLVLVRDEQFSGRKTVFNKPWYFSSDIPSLKMTFKINKESSDSDIQECIDLGLGSIRLMAQYNRLTNLKRKEVHRPDLEPFSTEKH
jgi:hypothetical protein